MFSKRLTDKIKLSARGTNGLDQPLTLHEYYAAENYYLKALSFDNNHIGALEYLGELYVETDRRDEALVLLNRIKLVAGDKSSEYKDLNKLLN